MWQSCVLPFPLSDTMPGTKWSPVSSPRSRQRWTICVASRRALAQRFRSRARKWWRGASSSTAVWDILPQAGTSLPNRRHPSALKIRSVAAGYCRSFSWGRIGLLTSSPPQFGHTPCKMWVAQSWQNVHSKEQIMASAECGSRSLLQHSQFGRNWSMGFLPDNHTAWLTRRW